MNVGIKLDSIINVAVKPCTTGFNISYGPSFPGNDAPVDYEQPTTIYIADPQVEVTYELYKGETPTPDGYISDGTVTGDRISLTTGMLTENTTFCIKAVKNNGLSAVLEETVTVIVAPNPGVSIAASPVLINYGQTAKIQILESQPDVKYRIAGYANIRYITGNGRTVELQTNPLQDDHTFQVEAVNPDDKNVIVTLNNNASVAVRPDPEVAVTIPDLNEQEPGEGNAGTDYKVARVVRNRGLTVHIEEPQAGVSYQLWKEGGDRPLFDGNNLAVEGTQYEMQSDPLDRETYFQILAAKTGENYTILTDTVRVEIEEQVTLKSDLVYYKSEAQVSIKASESDKIYTLYTGTPEPGNTPVESKPGNEEPSDGIITLETGTLYSNIHIYVTCQPDVEGGEDIIGEFDVNVTDRITAESTWILYNSSAKIIVGAPEPGTIYQLRSDAHNELSGSNITYSGDGTEPVELISGIITETTTFNVTEDGVELRPVITVKVMPHVSVENEFIPYNTPAVIQVCDPDGAIESYTLKDGDEDITIDTEKSSAGDEIITLVTEPLTEEGQKEITVYYKGDAMADGAVTVTIDSQVTAASSVGYGSQAVIWVAATAEGEEVLYKLYTSPANTGTLISANNIYDTATGITTLITNEGLTENQTYDVVREDDTDSPIATGITIAVDPQVTAPSPIPYYTQALVRIADTDPSKTYQLYVDGLSVGEAEEGNNGTLELMSSDPLREPTTFQVKDDQISDVGDPVEVTLYPQAYAISDTVPYNTASVNIVVSAAEAGVTYQAREKEATENTYDQEGTSVEGEDINIPINRTFTENTVFEVYKIEPGLSETKICDVRIAVTHQLIEKEICMDYDGPAFIRLGASIHPDDNIYDDTPHDVTYQLRLDADNTVIDGSEQTGNGSELIFKTSDNTEDTLYNILAIRNNPKVEDEEFRIWVTRVATVPEADISTDGRAMLSYGDGATLTLLAPDADSTYEILDSEGITLTGDPIAGGSNDIEYTTGGLDRDTHYIARVNAIDPEDENGPLITYLSRQTLMIGRLRFYGNGNYHFVNFSENDVLKITGDQTIEMWVKAAEPGNGEQVLYDKARTGEGTTSINDNDSFPKYNYGDSAEELLADTALTADEWVHIAVVRNVTPPKLQWYINGVLHGEMITLASVIAATDKGVRLGTEQPEDGPALQNFFNGLIADVRLWNVARDEDQIKNCMSRRLETSEINDDLAAYWKLDEGEGTVAGDASNNGIDGNINGAVWESEEQVIAYNTPATVVIAGSASETQYQLKDTEKGEVYAEATGDGNDLEVTTTIPLVKTTILQAYEGPGFETAFGDPTAVNVLHNVIEDEISTDGTAPVQVHIGASRPDTDYQLFFANDDNAAGPASKGTGDEILLTVSTDVDITEDTVLNVMASDGELVGIVKITVPSP